MILTYFSRRGIYSKDTAGKAVESAQKMVNISGILATAKNLSQMVLYHVPLRLLLKSFLFYNIYFHLFIYFAVLGLSCDTHSL